ncbi:MAG: hypothetical protein AMXMBFR4_03520 [Candidatus Hydrogenedentota bacterium]
MLSSSPCLQSVRISLDTGLSISNWGKTVSLQVSIEESGKKIIKSTIGISTDLDGVPQTVKVEVYGLRASLES